jgi:micrococcal nuclease
MAVRLACVASIVLSIAVGSPAAQTRETLLGFVNRRVPAVVTSVVDGDTVRVRLEDGRTIPVRLDGVDSPEIGEPFSAQARNATRVLLFDKQVELRGTDVDRYDRLVARITVGPLDSSVELVKAGLACHFTRYSSDQTLAAAQREAQTNERGFWAAHAARPACVNGRKKK